jgi:hypothetical protein
MPRIIALLFLAGGLQAANLENSPVWPMANGNGGIWPCGGGGTPDTLIASHLAGGGDQQFNGMDNGTGDYVGNGSGTDGTDNGMGDGAGSVRANGGRKWKVDEISWQMISQLILLPPIPFPSRDNFLWPFWVLSRAAYELGMDQLTDRVKQSSGDVRKVARFYRHGGYGFGHSRKLLQASGDARKLRVSTHTGETAPFFGGTVGSSRLT